MSKKLLDFINSIYGLCINGTASLLSDGKTQNSQALDRVFKNSPNSPPATCDADLDRPMADGATHDIPENMMRNDFVGSYRVPFVTIYDTDFI
ncbi:unnamed protein product [Dibothriocephalus latus]|uniref:Uncharacterized protein n=1 Tax=Dibothriocephalus latus TaxID=60516 RepID=A0A3P7L8M9_DIBLA|nr:unnamed protein product [Dibothriocephalus latus]